ncbi:hypothetical protein IJ750_05365 [bacterium]|nr:hypothetical protein [bacterium]
MILLHILLEPAILIITACFLFFILLVLKNYLKVKKNLSAVYKFLKSLNQKELSYRFQELDAFMASNAFTATTWEDFKKALIFPEKLYIASQNQKSTGDFKSEIYLTIDASYFFNEDTLVFSKINNKFIQTMPTLLTGLGPFFTFLKMAIAFTTVNFSVESEVGNSLNGLIANIQIAALCSVFAVGFSLMFMFLEKVMYNRMCKKYYLAIQKEFIRLFDVVTSEKFLIDLVKESKIQNSTNERLLKALPEDFAKAVVKSLGETTTPYLENILYSLNKLNESMNHGGNGDVVDKLF